MKGWVYVMSNPSMPNLLKIGCSSKDPEERRKELHTTGVPDAFVIEYFAMVEQHNDVERKVHKHLARARHSQSREFFDVSVEEAIDAIMMTSEVLYAERNGYSLDEQNYVGPRAHDEYRPTGRSEPKKLSEPVLKTISVKMDNVDEERLLRLANISIVSWILYVIVSFGLPFYLLMQGNLLAAGICFVLGNTIAILDVMRMK